MQQGDQRHFTLSLTFNVITTISVSPNNVLCAQQVRQSVSKVHFLTTKALRGGDMTKNRPYFDIQIAQRNKRPH